MNSQLSRPAKFLVLLLTNFLMLVIALFGFEFYLRSTDPFLELPFDTAYYRRHQRYYPELTEPPKPDHLQGSSWSWGHLIVNNTFGFRERDFGNPKPAHVCRIVVLGDSFTKGNGLAVQQRFTNLTEGYLNEAFPDRQFEVISLAQSGISTAKERNYLADYKDLLQPDLVVVGFVLNDTQPRAQNYSIERAQFEAAYGDAISLTSGTLVHLGLPKTAKALNEAVDNFAVWAGSIPPWEAALKRTYEPESTEWQEFRLDLQDIKKMSDELGLPKPVFSVLNQDIYVDDPTDFQAADVTLPIYLQWYHKAERTAAEIGYQTYNHEQEFIEGLNVADIPINVLDNHPSAKVNQIYARKLRDIITTYLVDGKLCRPDLNRGAVAASEAPLSKKQFMSVKLGSNIRFLGYAANRTQDNTVHLTLGWQALAGINKSYVVNIQLQSSDGQLLTQSESIPCRGDCPTLFWPPGIIVPPDSPIIYWPERKKIVPLPVTRIPYQGTFRDEHTIKLEPEIPNGAYLLTLSLVDPTTGRPLPTYDEIAHLDLESGQIVLGQLTYP